MPYRSQQTHQQQHCANNQIPDRDRIDLKISGMSESSESFPFGYYAMAVNCNEIAWRALLVDHPDDLVGWVEQSETRRSYVREIHGGFRCALPRRPHPPYGATTARRSCNETAWRPLQDGLHPRPLVPLHCQWARNMSIRACRCCRSDVYSGERISSLRPCCA
jgi:hypothetical protein